MYQTDQAFTHLHVGRCRLSARRGGAWLPETFCLPLSHSGGIFLNVTMMHPAFREPAAWKSTRRSCLFPYGRPLKRSPITRVRSLLDDDRDASGHPATDKPISPASACPPERSGGGSRVRILRRSGNVLLRVLFERL